MDFLSVLAAVAAAAPAVTPSPAPFGAKFWSDASLLLIDKLLIAAAILVVGYWINRAFERYKSEQALRAALAQRTLDNIGEVWQKVAEWEGRIDDRINQYLRDRRDQPENQLATLARDFGRDLPAILAECDDVMRVARKNRFWTGEVVYRSLTGYCEEIRASLVKIVPRNDQTINVVKGQFEKSRFDAAVLLDGIVYGDRSANRPPAGLP